MYTSTIATALVSLLAIASASPVTTRRGPGAQPKCTTTMTYEPTFHIQVMYAATVTSTSSVDCKGCALTIVGNDEAPAQTPAPKAPKAPKDRRQVINDPNTETLTMWATACAKQA
ncbi:hypothetical protein C1H76_8429 [Elsinoe australis]|uniref:Uncharacterized protein n=1 Tax=Elsinoe australis TaxID=40998 RepID=A0A4U7ASJ6_9PEZI|nr:hypothetical protein C1H76_8429 [Elsinoe australis]